VLDSAAWHLELSAARGLDSGVGMKDGFGRMRGLRFLLLWCAALSGARAAVAAPLAVDWEAPGCAEEAAFRARLRDALQRDPESALERELRVNVRIRENPEKVGYLLKVRIDAGTRELELPSCAEAVAAAATFVALAIDPNAVTPSSTEPAPAEPKLLAEPAKPTPTKLAPSVKAPQLERYVAALGGVSFGDVPALSPLVGGSIGVRLGWLGVAAEGFWIAPRTKFLSGTEKGGDIGLWGAGLSACYLLRRQALLLSGCLGAQGGAWRSRGVGVTAPTAQSDWWLAGIGRLGAGARVTSGLSLFLAMDAVVPARRPWFKLAGVGDVFRPKALSGRVSGGVELSF
jgi:hypothetical protein